jgi:ribosomal protein S14
MTGLKKKKKKKKKKNNNNTKSSQQEDLQILRREGIGNKILFLTRVQFRQHSKLHQDHL